MSWWKSARSDRPRSWLAALAFVALISPGVEASAQEVERPAVAVFDVHDGRPRQRLSPSELEHLTAYLRARLTESGSYRVVPHEQLREALAAAKKNSYRACIDDACQIALGKEVAAEKSLGTQVLEFGARCAVTLTLYDLRTALSERAGTEQVGCEKRSVYSGLERLVDRIAESRLSRARKDFWERAFEEPGVRLVATWLHGTWSAESSLELDEWAELKRYFGPRGLRVLIVISRDPGCEDAVRTTSLFSWSDGVLCDEDGAIAANLGTDQVPTGFLWARGGKRLVAAGGAYQVEAGISTYFRDIDK